MGLQTDPRSHFGDSARQTRHPLPPARALDGKGGNWPPATHLTDLPGGCQRVSSSLKEKWTRDSRPAGGSVRSGGRGLARGAAPERMGAKRRRGEHGDSGPVV